MTFTDQCNQHVVRIVSEKDFVKSAIMMQDKESVYTDSKAVNSDLSEEEAEEN